MKMKMKMKEYLPRKQTLKRSLFKDNIWRMSWMLRSILSSNVDSIDLQAWLI